MAANVSFGWPGWKSFSTNEGYCLMDPQKTCWTLVVMVGLAANLRTLALAIRRRRRLRESGRNGALRVIARQALRRELTTLAVQLLLASLVAAAWLHQEPALPSAHQFYVYCGWVLMLASLALMVDSLLDIRDQRLLCREPPSSTPAEGKR